MPKAPSYSPSKVDRAISDIQNNVGSLRSIAKQYGIPRATLQFKIKNPGHKTAFGPSPILTEVEENTIVRWITELARKGFPRKRADIISSVQQFLKDHPRPNPFHDNRPGEGWMKAFLKRHPEIVSRSTEAVTGASACVTENDIRKWFADIGNYIEEKKLEDVINDPSRIFNGDETGFNVCPQTGKVLAPKGCKNVYTIDRGSSRENITVMFAFSADGKTCSPMVVFPYQRIPEKISSTVPENWGIGRSDNGWMTAQTFYEYIGNVFHPYLVEQGVKLPVILFIDGHKSHLTYQLSVLCCEIGIELIALYPNATRILQPADVAVFRLIKMCWQQTARQWLADHPGESISKLTFTPLLKQVVMTCAKPETLQNGFKACGLYPFDANAIDYSKCLGGLQKKTDIYIDDRKNVTMNYSTFLKIVGEEMVEMFTKMHNVINNNQDGHFFALYRLWKYYNDSNLITNEVNALSTSNLEEENVAHEITATHNDNDQIPISGEHSSSGDMLEPEIQDNSNLRGDQSTLEEPSTASNETTSSKLIPIQTSSVNIVERTSNMGNYLMWPESPKRKGKRQTERLPFAITSRAYQEMLEKKNTAKANAEKERKRKKKEREEAKAAKVRKQILTKKSKSQTKCFICNRQKIDLTCDSCKKGYHTKCIPKSHQQHIPELEDGDSFMCHKCYKEDKSDESACEFNLEDKEYELSGQGYNSEDKEEYCTMQTDSAEKKEKDVFTNENNAKRDNDCNTLPEDQQDDVETLYQFYIDNKDK